MGAYILRRLLAGLFILWGVYTLTFFAVNLAPGDPFQAVENPKVQEEDLERLRALWGYDRPVVERYLLHVRKMFWKDPDVLESDGGGIAFEVRGEPGGNTLSARVQHPPASLRVLPTKRSQRDEGAQEVLLARGPEGLWPSPPIRKGRYRIGLKFFTVGEAPVTVDAEGLTVHVEGGHVEVRPSRTDVPGEIRLSRASGPDLVLPAAGEGRYGPVPAVADAYAFRDPAASSPVALSVPEKPLGLGGLGFDLGTSILSKTDVVEHLRLPLLNTLILASGALLVQFLVGVFLGVLSAVRRGGWADRGLTLTSLFFYSMPVFWLGVMLQLLFALRLGWLPMSNMHDQGQEGLLDLLQHLVMPVFVLGIGGAAATARYQRSAMLEVLGQDYVRTARAKGLSEFAVIWRHALKNALLPTITLLGLSLPFLVSGSVITEQIFNWPGMGREAIVAIAGRDVFVVTGITFLATSMVVLGSLLADVLYALVDPRVRLE